MLIDDACHKAHIERAYHDFDCHGDTWDALAELFEDETGEFPSSDFDLLGWFLINYHHHNGEWSFTKSLINC